MIKNIKKKHLELTSGAIYFYEGILCLGPTNKVYNSTKHGIMSDRNKVDKNVYPKNCMGNSICQKGLDFPCQPETCKLFYVDVHFFGEPQPLIIFSEQKNLAKLRSAIVDFKMEN